MDINQVLNETPAKMAHIGQEAENLRLNWQQEKEAYDRDEARLSLEFKARNQRKTATEIKCMVLNDTGLYEKRLALLVLEGTYRRKLKELEAMEHELNSAKILSRIKMSELNSIEFGIRKGEKDV